MILNQAQAQAVYGAMCLLNNVGADTGRVRIDVAVAAWGSTGVSVELVRSHREMKVERENYDSRAAFATAYGLNSDATPPVCSECQGRGEVETGIGMMVCTECPAR